MKMQEFEEKMRGYCSNDLRKVSKDFGKSEVWGMPVEPLDWGKYPAYMFHCEDGKILVYDSRNAESMDFYYKVKDAILGTEENVHLMDVDNIGEAVPAHS